MKKIKSFLLLIAIVFTVNSTYSQGLCITSCGTKVVEGLDSLVKNLMVYSCNANLRQHRIHLPASCAMVGCNSLKTRRLFAYYNYTNPLSDGFNLMWGVFTTAPSHWGYYGVCFPNSQPNPVASEYPLFPGDVSIGETGCAPNNVDFIKIKKLVNNVWQDELVNNIIAIANPRLISPCDPLWPYINVANYNNTGSAEGVMVDVTVTGNITYTGMIFHQYSGGYILWKQSCSEFFNPPSNTPMCAGTSVTMSIGNALSTKPYYWNFGDGSSSVGVCQNHSFSNPGNYTVSCSFLSPATTYTALVQVLNCSTVTCSSCIGSFAPDPGDYIVSLWVKEDNTNSNPPSVAAYVNSGVRVSFTPPLNFPPISTVYNAYGTLSSPIIDGWQRIETKISVPYGASQIIIELVNNNGSGIDTYFDDIRIHPVDANMKSYVYDPVTLRLSAELDENNYATFYEYDEEGKLIRVKKESEKGVMTIKETRSSNRKR